MRQSKPALAALLLSMLVACGGPAPAATDSAAAPTASQSSPTNSPPPARSPYPPPTATTDPAAPGAYLAPNPTPAPVTPLPTDTPTLTPTPRPIPPTSTPLPDIPFAEALAGLPNPIMLYITGDRRMMLAGAGKTRADLQRHLAEQGWCPAGYTEISPDGAASPDGRYLLLDCYFDADHRTRLILDLQTGEIEPLPEERAAALPAGFTLDSLFIDRSIDPARPDTGRIWEFIDPASRAVVPLAGLDPEAWLGWHFAPDRSRLAVIESVRVRTNLVQRLLIFGRDATLERASEPISGTMEFEGWDANSTRFLVRKIGPSGRYGHFWVDAATGAEIETGLAGGRLAFSPDEQWLAVSERVVGATGGLNWSLRTAGGAQIAALPDDKAYEQRQALWLPDSQAILVGIHNYPLGAEVRKIAVDGSVSVFGEYHGNGFKEFQLSPDGKIVAVVLGGYRSLLADHNGGELDLIGGNILAWGTR